ncbi:MAG: hypothetical protein LBJ18_03450 [Rickettsiales bacterium]|jgi:hypothetical protein|nr:hypothetical protein [Rickettsiales bacterium]
MKKSTQFIIATTMPLFFFLAFGAANANYYATYEPTLPAYCLGDLNGGALYPSAVSRILVCAKTCAQVSNCGFSASMCQDQSSYPAYNNKFIGNSWGSGYIVNSSGGLSTVAGGNIDSSAVQLLCTEIGWCWQKIKNPETISSADGNGKCIQDEKRCTAWSTTTRTGYDIANSPYNIGKTCSCTTFDTSCTNPDYCVAGYYKNGTGCTKCPDISGVFAGITSPEKSTSITDCFAGAGNNYTDSNGTFQFTNNCSYAL